MKRNVEGAFKLYSGDKPFDLFVLKLPENLEGLNQTFIEIQELFDTCGIQNFEHLPEDKADKAKFAQLFQSLNKFLYASRLQGFTWDNLTQTMPDGTVIEVFVDEETYNILLQRYHELATGSSEGGDEIPYDIDTQISELATGKINTDYMNANFTKFVRSLQANDPTEEQQRLLNSLHKSFATMSQEEQTYANLFLTDFMNGEIQLEEGKTLHDYIVEYQTRARDNRTQRFADALGLNVDLLRDAMRRVTSESSVTNAILNPIKDSMDREKAKSYFEWKEHISLSMRKVITRVDDFLRRFLLQGGFDIELMPQEGPSIGSTIRVFSDYLLGRIPLYTLRAACGYFEDGEVPEPEGWVDASGHGFTPDPERHFAVRAKGNSMFPKIHDDDLCVFEWYHAGTRDGEIVLMQCKDVDPDTGGKYTIKKYHSEKRTAKDGWSHTRITLKPLNSDFSPIELDSTEENLYRTIGIFKTVIAQNNG